MAEHIHDFVPTEPIACSCGMGNFEIDICECGTSAFPRRSGFAEHAHGCTVPFPAWVNIVKNMK